MCNCDLCEEGVHIQKTQDCIEMRRRLKPLSDSKRSIISLSTSKVHDSILRKFVCLFILLFLSSPKPEWAGCTTLDGVVNLCISPSLWKKIHAAITRIFWATDWFTFSSDQISFLSFYLLVGMKTQFEDITVGSEKKKKVMSFFHCLWFIKYLICHLISWIFSWLFDY